MAPRGNPNFTNPERIEIEEGNQPTEFELEVKRLGLSEPEIKNSLVMRYWARKHRNSRYIPEYLLRIWGLEVSDDCFGMFG